MQGSEGIVISKMPYKESHLICRLLTRTGNKSSILFYGGQGGGKKNKPSQIEVGSLIEFTPASTKKYSELRGCKDWKVQWRHEELKNHYRAFFLLNFYAEVFDKISMENHREEKTGDEIFFNLLSNAVFYLEDSVKKKNFELTHHLSLFLGKLIFHNGVYPSYENCRFCLIKLSQNNVGQLDFSEGGFSCLGCQEDKETIRNDSFFLWEYFATIKNVSYKDYQNVEKYSLDALKVVLSYFLGQFQIAHHELKTTSFLFH